MIDPTPLWDFDDPAASEERFREAAEVADARDQQVLRTQVARALGLQGRYDEGHAVLDAVTVDDDEVAARVALERGRLLRSGGEPREAGPRFAEAREHARRSGRQDLEIDAIHMQALVAAPEEALALNEAALSIARASSQPAARNWDASLLNNIGMTLADSGDFAAALARFEEAQRARERTGNATETRVARWMVGWAMRNLGRRDEALEVQRSLKAELEALGEVDPYVDEELALLQGQDPSLPQD